jgi:hypothetical protein
MNFLGELRSQQCALALTVDQAMRLAAFPSYPAASQPAVFALAEYHVHLADSARFSLGA